MSFAPQVGFGGKDCSKTDSVLPMCSAEYGREDGEGEREEEEMQKGKPAFFFVLNQEARISDENKKRPASRCGSEPFFGSKNFR